MPAKNDVFFTAASLEKDSILDGHLFPFSALLIPLQL